MTPFEDDQRQQGGGRREYDPDGPFAVLRAEMMREIEKSAAATRHGLREEFGATLVKVEASVARGQAQSSQEHAAALNAIGELSTNVRLMARDLEDVKPLAEKVATLQTHDQVDEAKARASSELMSAFNKQRQATRNWNVAVLGTIITATAVLLDHVHHI